MNAEQLARENMGYAVKLARRFSWLDFEDARSEAFLGLVIAAQRQASRADALDRPFLPLARTVIENRLINLSRREAKHSRRRADVVDCAYEVEFKIDGSAKELKRALRRNLTAEEWRLVRWLRRNYSQGEIAERLGVSRRTVIRKVARIRIQTKFVLRGFF